MTGRPPDDDVPPATESDSLTTLRGAAVAVDPRRTGRVIALVCVAGLAIAGVVLLIAAAHQNAQINALKTRGAAVTATVTSCTGQVAGSGSNPTGYACRAAYRVDGHAYRAMLPGTDQLTPGGRVMIVVDRADPTLISTPRVLAAQHASGSAFVLPILLLVAAAVIAVALWWRRGRRRPAADAAQPARRSLPESPGDDRLGALGGV